MSRRPMPGDHRDLLDELTRRVSEGIHDLQVYLATPEGRELRRRVAQFAIIATPLLFRMRFFRASPVGRVIGVIGGAALVVKLAEALRDWEPTVELERAWMPTEGG